MVGALEGRHKFWAGRHIQIAVDPNDGRATVGRAFDIHVEVAKLCHRRECKGRCATEAKRQMNDVISLTMPARVRYLGVATLVLGGIGSRLDLSYERMDDLQLAVLSVLEAGGPGEVTLEVDAADERVSVSIGPLAAGRGLDESLARVLDPLVDSFESVERDGREWLELQLSR